VYHRSQPDIVIVAVTSQTTPQGPTDTLLKDWQSAGLLKPSLVKAAFATIEPSLVRFRIGKISPTDQKQLDRRIRIALNL
jgi:mRNA interferase MazF